MRLIHLTNLPGDLVFVLLDNEFRKNFLRTLKKVFGTYKKIGEPVGYTANGIIDTFRIKNRFTKLSTIIKLSNTLSQRGYPDFNLNKIEKKIIAYRGIGTSLIIKNPIFPLREDERMVRIFFHLIGDGYGGKYGAGKPFYRNYAKELLDEFEKDLKVFGEVPCIKRETIVEIPSVIGYILEHVYKINFESYKSFIPPAIFKLSRESIAQGIKAFADDEANMGDSRIRFYSFNKKLLSGVRSLLIKTFPEFNGKVGGVREYKTYLRGKKYIGYCFPILSGGLKFYYDLISFSHLDKLGRLERHIERKEREWVRRNSNITKLLILQNLKTRSRTVKEISKNIGITENSVRSHFEGNISSGILSLRKMGLAEDSGLTKTRAKIWTITNKGIRFLKENENKLDKFLVKGNISKFYLALVKQFQAPSKIAKEINRRNDTVSKRLLKLYRNNYLTRSRIGKKDYRYKLTKKGVNLLQYP